MNASPTLETNNPGRSRLIIGALIIVAMAALSSPEPAPREQVGLLPDGGFLLNSGWRVKAAGTQVALDTLPMSSVLSRDGRFMIVLNGGYRPPSLSVLDTKSGAVIGRTPVPDAWLGLALAPDGRTIWVGGGSKASVFEFSLNGETGALQATRTFELVPSSQRTYRDFIGDVAVSPDGRLLYACNIYHDTIDVVNPQSGMIIEHFKTGRRPYRIMFHPDGKTFFVTSWADGSMYRHQSSDGSPLQTIRLGAHPTDMVWRDRGPTSEDEDSDTNWTARIFVSAANTNNVYAVGVPAGTGDLRVVETINVSTTVNHPLGMTPSALALSTDKKRLYVACSDANAAAVVDVSQSRSHVLGFLPTGWYPTALGELADGRLVILNGRGSRSYANPHGPSPVLRPADVHGGAEAIEYVGRIQTGSASIIQPFTPEELKGYTAEVLSNSPYTDEKLEAQPAGLPPIEHILYIVKENRTYDQVLGDIGKGESDPSLCLFTEKVGPNHHKLAREFVLFDNFYVNSDVSADGHNWSTAAIASDYVEKLWPNSYAKRRVHYDYEGGEPAALPPAGYLWTNASARGISMRNYGYWATNLKTPTDNGVQIETVRDSVLAKVTNMNYRGFDLEYPDVKRAQTFLDDLKQFESTGKMPALMFMRLGNDHTNGTAAGKIAPLSSFADNDYALGMIVEGLSHSTFWKSLAIFVLEDDAQNGPDHIDAHRSPAFVISPYTRTGAVNSTMFNTASMLRTMELFLHLRPMTHFDAGARPMLNCFAKQPVMTPYQAEKPRISLDERNPQNSTTAARSAELDFSEADLNDDDELNDILWRAIRHTDPPAPVRSLFGR